MNLQDDQKVDFTVSGTDRAGNAVDLTALSAVSSDETILTVTDNGGGSYTAITTGVLGSAVVTVSDDVDGDGTGDFTGSQAFDVVPGGVAEIALSVGTPVSRFDDAPVDPDAPVDGV